MEGQIQYRRNCVALLSDFGYESFYVAAMKAVIHHAAPDARVVDVAHDVTPFAVDEGSFILRTIFPFFPPGTVFLAVVDPGVGGKRGNLIVGAESKYLVAPDNGLVTDISRAFRVDACWRIQEERIERYRVHPRVGSTFLGRDIFAPVAGAIAGGAAPDELGTPIDGSFETLIVPPLVTGEKRIEGFGRYVDHFGNVVTDITGEHLQKILRTKQLADISVHIGAKIIKGIQRCYVGEPKGTLMAVLNSWNLIEVSVSRGRADAVLGISKANEMHIILEA